jgi:hypothetical protein
MPAKRRRSGVDQVAANIVEAVVGCIGLGDEAVIFFQLLARHADLFEIHMSVDRLVVLGTDLSVCLDRHIDRIGRGSSGLGRGADRHRGNGADGRNGQEVPPRLIDGGVLGSNSYWKIAPVRFCRGKAQGKDSPVRCVAVDPEVPPMGDL